MKTLLVWFTLFAGSQLATAQEARFCTECGSASVIATVDGCTITGISSCFNFSPTIWNVRRAGEADFDEQPGGALIYPVDGPSTYEVSFLYECEGETYKATPVIVQVTCEDCPHPGGQVDFTATKNTTSEGCTFDFTPDYSGLGQVTGYFWTFTDGMPSFSTSMLPSVDFPEELTETEVCLTVQLAEGPECDSTTICKTIPLDCLCDDFLANFTYTLDSCTLSLDGSSTTTDDNPISFYSYLVDGVVVDFGFNSTPGLSTYQFSSNGIYEVCLYITYSSSPFIFTPVCSDQICKTVIVTDCGETCINNNIGLNLVNLPDDEVDVEGGCGDAFFTILPTGIATGSCENNLSYWIDYGDGNVCHFSGGDCDEVSTGLVRHQYAENGTYTVCGYVYDNCGCYNFDCTTVTIDCYDDMTTVCEASFISVESEECEMAACDLGTLENCSFCFQSTSTPSNGSTITQEAWLISYLVGDEIETFEVLGNSVKICPPTEVPEVKVCVTMLDDTFCKSSYCETITNSCARINELNIGGRSSNPINEKLMVFPNPSRGQIEIQCVDVTVELQRIDIFDLKGQLVWQQDGRNQSAIQIQELNLPNGTYMLQAITKTSIYTEKLVITP